MSAPGRPKREFFERQREGSPVSAARRREGACTLQAALAQAGARPLAGAGHAAGHDTASGSRPSGGQREARRGRR